MCAGCGKYTITGIHSLQGRCLTRFTIEIFTASLSDTTPRLCTARTSGTASSASTAGHKMSIWLDLGVRRSLLYNPISQKAGPRIPAFGDDISRAKDTQVLPTSLLVYQEEHTHKRYHSFSHNCGVQNHYRTETVLRPVITTTRVAGDARATILHSTIHFRNLL